MPLYVPPPFQVYTILHRLMAADLNSTADQQFTKVGNWTTAMPLGTQGIKRSGTWTSALGGWYPSPAKAGTALVAAGTDYSAMTANGLCVTYALAVATKSETMTPPYLSLTTPNGSAMTADLYILGIILT